jgi:hypothetical protein
MPLLPMGLKELCRTGERTALPVGLLLALLLLLLEVTAAENTGEALARRGRNWPPMRLPGRMGRGLGGFTIF